MCACTGYSSDADLSMQKADLNPEHQWSMLSIFIDHGTLYIDAVHSIMLKMCMKMQMKEAEKKQGKAALDKTLMWQVSGLTQNP